MKMEKNKIDTELSSFIEQMLDKFEKHMKIKGTFLEKPFIASLQNIHLQLKYISETDKSAIVAKPFAKGQHELIYRQAEILNKIIFAPFAKSKGLKGKASFAWEKYKCKLSAEEYIDIVLSCFSSLFESYNGMLKNGNIFDCVKLAGILGAAGASKIDNLGELEKLYAVLAEKTKENYKNETKSLFSMQAYKVRCACFHMTYRYEPLPPYNFKIIMKDSSSEIDFDKLLTLALEIMVNMNALMVVSYYFSKGALPVKTEGGA